MRIISKLKDYYDIGMSLGQDEQVVWVRTEEVIEIKVKSLGIQGAWFNNVQMIAKGGTECNVVESYIALGGKLHPMMIGTIKGGGGGLSVDRLGGPTYEDVRDRFITLVGRELIRPYSKYEPYKPRYGYRYSDKTAEADRAAWLSKPCHELHTRFDCPLLLISKGSVTKCPNLKAIGFQRIRDPYSVFQDISMYISGVMGQTTNPMVAISDKSKILKHGFDYKYGFRTRPKE